MASSTLAVIGGGLVGRQVLETLVQRDVDPENVRVFTSGRSEGEEFSFGEDTLGGEKLAPGALRGIGAAIVAVPPEASPAIAKEAQQLGVWSVDVSGAQRADANVPLVSPGANEHVLDEPFSGRVVSLAHPATQAVLAILTPLRKSFGLVMADVTILAGAAARGSAGVERLSKQTTDLMNAKEPDVELFPHRLAFNVIPAVGPIDTNGLSQLERTLLMEIARIWKGTEMPAITSTALHVPTYHGMTLVLSVHLRRSADAEAIRGLLKATEGLKVLDEPQSDVYPMPMLTTDDDAIHVGRVRTWGERIQLIAALDPLTRIAATAIDIAQELATRGETH